MVEELENDLLLRLDMIVRGITSKHFNQQASQGPHIRLVSIIDIESYFRSQPVKTTHNWTLLGSLLTLVELDAATEVAYLDDSLTVQEHIGTLQVPVDDVVAVQVHQSLQDLAQVHSAYLLIQFAELSDQVPDASSRHILHYYSRSFHVFNQVSPYVPDYVRVFQFF